jgi:predicted acetyltransferase
MSTQRGADVEITALGPEDLEAVVKLDVWAFGFDYGEANLNSIVACFEWDRTYGVLMPDANASGAGRSLKAVNSAYSMKLPVPGGEVDCAGLSWVGVHPGHRRQGLARAMVADHLLAVRERGEPVSALNASEASIYGRFGYGRATTRVRATIARGTRLRDIPGADQVPIRLEEVDVERHADLVGDCYEAARRHRPGMVSRNSPAQRRNRLDDPPAWREGAEGLRIFVAEAEDGGTVRGYALFRRVLGWTDAGLPDGVVKIRELVARDPAAAAALWKRLLDLDLMATVQTDDRATDDPLFHQLLNLRAAGPRIYDGLWVRLVDLPAALASRRYSTEVDVVIEVRDELCPWNAGRWHLVAGPEHAACTPTQDPAAFTIDIRELGGAYLGAQTLDGYAAAGLLAVSDESGLVTASRAFSWPVAAHCNWRF